jgi:hypothetical protein
MIENGAAAPEVGPTSGGSEPAEVRERSPAPVTIVELRREIDQHNRSAVKGSKRQYHGRWMVGWNNGFWRQQAYGPGRSLRKPILIAPHTAGPQGAQLIPPSRRCTCGANRIASVETATAPMQLWPFLRVHSDAAGADRRVHSSPGRRETLHTSLFRVHWCHVIRFGGAVWRANRRVRAQLSCTVRVTGRPTCDTSPRA